MPPCHANIEVIDESQFCQLEWKIRYRSLRQASDRCVRRLRDLDLLQLLCEVLWGFILRSVL